LKLAHHIINTDQSDVFLDTLSEPPEFKGVNLCTYCKTPLRTLVYRSGLCAPCKELYRMHFIRRDYGVYRKNTSKQRSDILSDESSSFRGPSFHLSS